MRFFRNRFLQFVVDGLVVAVALLAAYFIRWTGEIPPRDYLKQFLLIVPYLVLLRVGLLASFGVYRLIWRYVSLRDIPRILAAVGSGTLLLVAVRVSLPTLIQISPIRLNPKFATVPYGVLAAELVLTLGGIVAARALWRIIKERGQARVRFSQEEKTPPRGALLIGAGDAGVMVARQVRENPRVGFSVLGFLDDDPNKHGTVIQGFKVLGPISDLEMQVKRLGADLAVLTIAAFPGESVRRVMDLAKAAGVDVKIIPAFHELSAGIFNLSNVRDVAIEDLLGRAPVELEEEAISSFIQGKRVLITGAGGSIGSEMCRQVCRYRPARLFLLDQAENPLFHIHRELAGTFPDVALDTLIGSVANRDRMRQLMLAHRPEVVIHAAAHKHVPLMECNPGEAVRNNIHGSRTMAELALEAEADAFVMISTDKAVNPTSVMGASKRMAEMYVQALAATSKSTRIITVRFGNVLGSEGSVVPIFKQQITDGGPVTVTHPEMIRYFMTIPEASQLVLQAAAMGDGGEIFILEMGEPVKIVDLARDLITLSGMVPDRDIKIEFTGMRPGEKMFEEINLSEEHATKTMHPRIWVGESHVPDRDKIAAKIDALLARSSEATPEEIRAGIAECVTEYRPNPEGSESASRPKKAGDADADAEAELTA